MKVNSIERENLKPGDILLCPPVSLPTGWIGQAIVALTKGRVSHAALYYGEKDGEMQVAHSDLKGIRFQPIDQFLNEAPGCYVLKLNKDVDLSPVLKAAEDYIKDDNKYPVTNFVFLGLLLLMNGIPQEKLRGKAFYCLILNIYLKLMKKVNEKVFTKNAMTCSQFVTQCFTDTPKKTANIEFEKLFIQVKASNLANGEVSLLGLLDDDDIFDADLFNTVTNDNPIADMDMEEIAAQFVLWMNDEGMEDSEDLLLDLNMFKDVSKCLAIALCQILTGKKAKNKKEVLRLLSDTDKNYFVLPDDLLSNTKNLKNMGYVVGHP